MKNLSEQKFSEMIYAFSAGCLDKDEFGDFLEYLKSGRRVPENQLGELQNVVSLLPAMLELETPDVQVKDKVAKRLYRMREELKAKKKQTAQNLTPEALQPLNENVFAEKVYEAQEEKKAAPPLKTTGRMTVEKPAAGTEPSDKKNSGLGKSAIVEVPFTDLDKSATLNETPEAFSSGAAGRYRTMDAFASDPLKEEPLQAEPASVETPATGAARQKWEEEKSERSSRNLIILAVILVFVLITGGIIYYAMNREISQGKNQIASLSGQVNALNSEILRLDRNQKVLAVLSAKDLRTVNLDGADGNPGGFGKLSLLQNGNEGVIQFYNMPALKDSQVYQLWLSSKGKYYSLGTFKTKRDIEYFPFSVPEVEQDKIDSYIVTLESTDGRTTPSDKIYLMTTSNSR